MKAYRSASDLPIDRRAKAAVGNLLRSLRPDLAKRVDARPFDPDWTAPAKLIRNAHLFNAVDRKDHETLRRYLTHYWSSAASTEFYEGFSHRFEDLFLRYHAVIADHIAALLPLLGDGPIRLVEVGCGDGRVLEWFAARFDRISDLHGVDLNSGQIEKCRAAYSTSPRCHFHEGDLLEWLQANPVPRTVLVSNGGVFEYLLEHELLNLFSKLRLSCAPCLVAITESIATDHDLEAEVHSLPYGHEFALSHNYPALFRSAGFELTWKQNRPTQPGEENHPVRWFQLVAHS